jgi:hypothetical protein
MESKPFKPHAGYTSFPEAHHVIPDDGFPHSREANTCACQPTVSGSSVIHRRHRAYTATEAKRIRQGDAYDPEDGDLSDEIIARGTFVSGH